MYIWTDVKDLAFQDYAVPHHSLPEAYQTPLTPARAPPPLQTLLPKPPPVPPPPEQYYAATEICNAGYVPPPPLLTTPPTVRVAAGSKNRRPRHASSPRKYVGPWTRMCTVGESPTLLVCRHIGAGQVSLNRPLVLWPRTLVYTGNDVYIDQLNHFACSYELLLLLLLGCNNKKDTDDL